MQNEKMGEIINESIDHLPELDKIILKEFYLNENSIGEIADIVGKSKHYISVRKVRAIIKVRNKIQHQKRMGNRVFYPVVKIKRSVIMVK